MMKPRSAPVTSIAESMHERQHFVEHASGAERAQAFEQRRDLAQIVDRDVACLSTDPDCGASSSRKTMSAPPLRPRRIEIAVRQLLSR